MRPPFRPGSARASPPRSGPGRRGRCRGWRRRRRRASPISVDDREAARRVQRGRGLVQQENGILGHEHPGDVHPLLLAARERDRRERPEPLRDAEPREHGARALERVRRGHAPRAQRARHHLSGRHPRDHPQELADVADRAPADVQDEPRRRRPPCPPPRSPCRTRMRPAWASSCRIPRAAACSCPRRTGRPAPRTRRAGPPGSRRAARAGVTPPWTCRVKVLPSPRISSDGRRSRLEHRGHQQLRVRMLGVVEHLVGEPRLHDLAARASPAGGGRAAAPPRGRG